MFFNSLFYCFFWEKINHYSKRVFLLRYGPNPFGIMVYFVSSLRAFRRAELLSREVSTTWCRTILRPNERIESTNRIVNRIDELNQQVAFQNDPLIASWAAKTVPREPKRPPQDGSKAPQDPPKRSQEPPRAAQDTPKTIQEPPRSPLGLVLGPSWDQATTRSKSRPSTLNRWNNMGSILAPQMGPKSSPRRPKTSQKSKRKMHHLLYCWSFYFKSSCWIVFIYM